MNAKLGKRLPFDLTVFVETRPYLRDEGLDSERFLGRDVLDKMFDLMEEFDNTSVVLSFPERWLNILEQQALIKRLVQYGKRLQRVQILTHSTYILQNCPNESVRGFVQEWVICGDDRGKLYAPPHCRFLHHNKLNVLGGSVSGVGASDAPVINDTSRVYRKAAEEMLKTICARSDFDIDQDAKVSESDDGAYVQVWVWIPKEDVEEE